MKQKAWIVLLLLCMVFSLNTAEAEETEIPDEGVSLTDGDVLTATDGDITWSLISGVVTISGNNVPMPDYDYNRRSPWSKRFEEIQSIVIQDGITSIGRQAFSGCSSLTSVTISDSVTSIGRQAFQNCSSLTSVTIPDSVTSIWEQAFYRCRSLESVTIPDSITSIGDGAFTSCSSLTSVTIGKSVTRIGQNAFNGCSSLTSVTIPDSVTSIENHAFAYCSSLTDVYYGGSEEQWNRIPKGSYNGYLTRATTTKHYNSDGPESGGTGSGHITLTIHSDADRLYTREETTISAVVSGGQDENPGFLWSVDDTTLVEFVSSSVNTDSENRPVSFARVRNISQEIKTVNVTVRLAGGQSASCTIQCAGQKPAYQVPSGTDNVRDGYITLQDAARTWRTKYDDYTKQAQTALQKYVGSDSAAAEDTVKKEAARMQRNDAQSKSTYLAFRPASPFPENWKPAAYYALAKALSEHMDSRLQLDSNSNIPKNVLKALFAVKNEVYEYQNIRCVVNITGFDGQAAQGSITCSQKGKNNPQYKVDVTPNLNQFETSVKNLYGELENLWDSARQDVYKAVFDDIFDRCILLIDRKTVDALITKYSNDLKNAGLGGFLETFLEFQKYYEAASSVDNGVFDAVESLLDLSFGDDLPADQKTRKKFDALKNASDNFKTKYNAYQNGTLKDNIVQKCLKAVFGCPISVAVYNSSGVQIGYVGEDDVWYTDAVDISEVGDGVTITSYTQDRLSFSIVGTDYGVMGCSIEEFDADNAPTGRVNFYEVEITPETELSLTLPDTLGASADSVALTAKTGETVAADEYISVEDAAGVTISCTPDSGSDATENRVFGTGMYVKGDLVLLTAEPQEGWQFRGWYDGEILLETSWLYEFPARKDVTLTASFEKEEPKRLYAIPTDNPAQVDIYDPDNLLREASMILAARYQDDGKMLDCAAGTLNGTSVTFPRTLDESWTLFFLGKDYAPLCPKVPLSNT